VVLSIPLDVLLHVLVLWGYGYAYFQPQSRGVGAGEALGADPSPLLKVGD